MKPGYYEELSNEEYHGSDGISKSGLDKIAKSPLAYKTYKETPQEPTKAMKDGSAIHKAVFEPDDFFDEYACAPEGIDKRTKVGKAQFAKFEQESEGKIVISAPDLEIYRKLAKNVRDHKMVKNILKEGVAEASMYTVDEDTEVLCKVRPDWFIEDVMVDLKTTTDASPEAFMRAMWNFRYYVQAAFYMDIAGAVLERHFNVFLFIVVEKGTGLVAIYEADQDVIRYGREEYRRCLEIYKSHLDSDEWPGYNDDKIVKIGLPGWATKQLDERIVGETF